MSAIQKEVVKQIRKYMRENGIEGKVTTIWQEAPDRARGLEIGWHVFVSSAAIKPDEFDKFYEFAKQFRHPKYGEDEIFHMEDILPPTVTKVWINRC